MTRAIRFRRILATFLWLILAVGVSARWIGHAQRPGSQEDDPRFTGISTRMESTDLRVSRRRFEPGARSAWHHHSAGQLLFVEAGRARTQKREQPMREMGPGESDYTGPDVEHWHGAAPSEAFIQIAVGFGGEITWLEKTTDGQYEGR